MVKMIITKERIEDVPNDFPRVARSGPASAAAQKLLIALYEDKPYAPGLTPLEIYLRWHKCENFAQTLSQVAMASKRGKRAHMTEEEILEQYIPRLKAEGFGAPEEMEWIVNRAGIILGWRSAT